LLEELFNSISLAHAVHIRHLVLGYRREVQMNLE